MVPYHTQPSAPQPTTSHNPPSLSTKEDECGTIFPTMSPINWFDRLQASFVLAITPEVSTVKAARGSAAKPYRDGNIQLPIEYRVIAGTKVRIAQGGKADAETILMLCPLPQSIVAFDPIWHLLKDNYRLIALDIPGFGGSDGGAEFMTFEAQGRFLNSFVDEMDLHDFHILGPDVGMAAALHYVTHYEHKVRSLMIGDGPGVSPSLNGSVIDKCVNSSFWRLVFTVAGAGPFVHAANQLAAVHYQLTNAEVQDYVDSYKHRIPAILEWFKGYPCSLASVDPLLENINIPVKIFWGELDQFLFVENARNLAKRLKRADVQIFPNAGHYVYQDDSENFAKMVCDWVGSDYMST